jgi:chromosome segregation ATPase
MGAALKLYEELLEAGEDKRRAKLIAEAFEALEARYPDLRDVATHAHLRETELRLLREIEALRLETRKEIEGVRLEMKEVEANLRKDIEAIRLEMKEVEANLRKEMHEIDASLRKEIEGVRLEIKNVEVRLTQAIHRQTVWVILAIGGITGFIRWLDVFFK